MTTLTALLARADELVDRLMCQSIESDAGNCDERNAQPHDWCVVCTAEALAASLRADVEAPAHAPVMHDCEQWAQEGMGCAHCNSSAVALREVWADDPVRAERDALRLQVAALSAAPPADGAPCGLLKPGSSFSRCVRWPDHEGPCVYAIEAAPPAPTPRRHCLGDVCDLAKSTGVFCAHDECDIDLGVRTVAAPAPTGAPICGPFKLSIDIPRDPTATATMQTVAAGGDFHAATGAPADLWTLVCEWRASLQAYEDGDVDLREVDEWHKKATADLLAWHPAAPALPPDTEKP